MNGRRVAALAIAAGVALPIGPLTGGAARADDQPRVSVELTSMSPNEVTAQGGPDTLTLSATVTNTGGVPLDGLRARVGRGIGIQTRNDLAATDARLPEADFGSCEWQDLPGRLAPGDRARIDYHCDLPRLSLTVNGIYPRIYPLGLTVDGLVGDNGYQTVGDALTYLPVFPDPVSGTTEVAWLWPLIDRPHRLVDDTDFRDDDLGVSVAPGGRLDRMLRVAEHAPESVPLTLVLDPALVDDLVRMENGYRYHADSGFAEGEHGQDATAWLNRLRALAHRDPVTLVPYGDTDVVALTRAQLGDLATVTDTDRALVADRLDTTPRTDLVWPPGGALTPTVVNNLGGPAALVLAANAVSGDPDTEHPIARVTGPNGDMTVLVPDPGLDRVVARAGTVAAGPLAAAQRYLAELAMITAEAPSVAHQVLVTPPRRWDVDPSFATPMLTAATTVPWLAPASVSDWAGQRPDTPARTLTYPDTAAQAELPGTLTASIARVRANVSDIAEALVDQASAERLIAPYRHALRRAGSSAWRDDSPGGDRFTSDMDATISGLRSGVHLIKPAGSGVYTLAARDSPLVLTVANDLPETVRIRLRITTRGTSGFEVGDIGEQVIQAGTRRTLRIPARVERTGVFIVDALVTTPGGQPLGAGGRPVEIKVRSTAYGMLGLAITGAASLVLVLLVARRVIGQVRRRRAGTRPGSVGGAERAALPAPTARPAAAGAPTERSEV